MVYIRAWHIDQPDEVLEQEITAGQLTIGRGLDNDIQLDVGGASRHHVVVSLEKGRVWVVDRGSTNGTWIGGRRVNKERLTAGERFQIGTMVFEVATASLTRPTVVEDWGSIQVEPGRRPPVARLRNERAAAASASVTLVEPSSGRPLRPEKLVPSRGLGIGRDPTNELCLEDGEVSRFHARVEVQGERFVLEDLGSRNGTWVNRIRVRQHLLAHRDRFRVGSFTLLFRAPGQSLPAPCPVSAQEDPTPTPREGLPLLLPPTAAHAEVPGATTIDVPPPAACAACGAPLAPDDRFCGNCDASYDPDIP